MTTHKRSGVQLVVLLAVVAFAPALFAQRAANSDTKFDPKDLNGSWIGTGRIYGDNNPVPEPPLTDWAKQNLMLKNISHAGLNATAKAQLRGSAPQRAKTPWMKTASRPTSPRVTIRANTASPKARR